MTPNVNPNFNPKPNPNPKPKPKLKPIQASMRSADGRSPAPTMERSGWSYTPGRGACSRLGLGIKVSVRVSLRGPCRGVGLAAGSLILV